MKSVILPLLLSSLLLPVTLVAAEQRAPDPCLDCHREKTPAAVRQWQESAHARAGVGCAACHGSDHARIDRGEAPVGIKICGGCHPRAAAEHTASRHGMGLHSGWGCTRHLSERSPGECRFCHEEGSTQPKSTVQCARFLKQTTEVGMAGCNSCHNVESSCASCHTNHGTDLKIVRDPGVCAKCHMGPDHPQWEMWQTSQHGTLFAAVGPQTGPTCQRCHMAAGSHDVSVGITMSSGGIPSPTGEAAKGRAEMLKICSGCHATGFAKKELARGDVIRDQSLALVKEGEEIIWDLLDRQLLDPMPDNRPPHPLRGGTLVTDSQMLYEDTSHIERLFFKMKKYDLARTTKGAYHQNPAYLHWYGNAELKMDLIDIRAEASRLKSRAPAAPATSTGGPEERLRLLKRKLDRGGITTAVYEKEKALILKDLNLK